MADEWLANGLPDGSQMAVGAWESDVAPPANCGSKRCAAMEKEAAARKYCFIVLDFIALHKIVLLLARSAAYNASTKFLSLSLQEDNTASGKLCLSTNFSQCACLEQNVRAALS